MSLSPSWRAPALLVVLWLIWGYNWVVSKTGLHWMGALEFAAGRTVLATLTLGIILLCSGRVFAPPPWRATLWLGLTQTTGFTGLTHLALVAGGAGKVSVLAYTMPFWILPLAWLWLGERVRGGQWLAIALALLGLLAILEPWRASHGAGLPEALALAGGVSWAASAIIAKQLRAAHTVDVLALTFWQMLYGLPPLLALAWLWPGAPTAWAEPGLWLTLGFAGVFAGGIGWLMWLMLLGRLSAGAAGLNVLIIPAIAVLAAWLQLGERPSPAEFAGMALIALALSLLALLNMKPPSRGD